jgi:hypothetical protein
MGVGEEKSALLGPVPWPGIESLTRPPKVGALRRGLAGFSGGAASPPPLQLGRLCRDHVQERRAGAPGAQPRRVTAPRPGGRAQRECRGARVARVSGPAPPCAPRRGGCVWSELGGRASARTRAVCVCMCVCVCDSACQVTRVTQAPPLPPRGGTAALRLTPPPAGGRGRGLRARRPPRDRDLGAARRGGRAAPAFCRAPHKTPIHKQAAGRLATVGGGRDEPGAGEAAAAGRGQRRRGGGG